MLVVIWGMGTLGQVYSQAAGAHESSTQGQLNTPETLATETNAQNYQSQDETLLTFPDSPESSDQEPISVNTLGMAELIRMVLALGGVLVLIYAVFWFIKKARTTPAGPSSLFQVRDQLSLGGSKSIYLVQLVDQWYILGGSDGSLNLISEISDAQTIQEIQVSLAQRGAEQTQSFSGMMGNLTSLIGKVPQKRSPNNERVQGVDRGSQEQAFDFMEAQKERLKKW